MESLNEGIIYNENSDTFEFDFNSNSEKCSESEDSCHLKMTIKFSDLPLEPINLGYKNTYYFGYQFVNNDNASSKIRTKFFNSLRFNKDFTTPENKRLFVVNALNKLGKQINVYTFDTIVYPKSRSYLNQYILKLLGNTVPNWEGLKIEDLLNIESKQKVLDAKKILLIDDVTTTGSTLFETIKNIRLLNQDAIIVIFTLVGKKELHD